MPTPSNCSQRRRIISVPPSTFSNPTSESAPQGQPSSNCNTHHGTVSYGTSSRIADTTEPQSMPTNHLGAAVNILHPRLRNGASRTSLQRRRHRTATSATNYLSAAMQLPPTAPPTTVPTPTNNSQSRLSISSPPPTFSIPASESAPPGQHSSFATPTTAAPPSD